MTSTFKYPAISNEGGLSVYLDQIKKFPMLDAEEEYMLAKNWKTTGNVKSAEKLVTSNLRLVAKIAMGYKGYGLPMNEIISEGNVGLMQAVKKFEPEKGFRLATYAMWWIKASIQEYILRSWSLVKIGTTTAQKKLFFNLKKLKNQIAPQSQGDLRKEHVNEIAEKLVTSHLRLVAKIAMRYKGYGLPMNEIISEGNVGLMQAVKKFEPEKGFRLATYAMWWIKASIQEYILRSWSLVKIGTTTAQKKLFFNLKKLKNQIAPKNEGDLKKDEVEKIANTLDVSEDEVISMNRRLSGKEQSLNAPIGEDGDEWQDWVVDKEMDQELKIAHQEELDQRKDLLQDSIKILNDREKEILYARRLNENPSTLEDLSKKYKISRERIRQIENKAFEKLQKHMLNSAKSKNLLPVN